jgi:hypothetical protein
MKIEEQELQSLNQFREKIVKYIHDIGVLEFKKHNSLHLVGQLSLEQEELMKALEEKYGKIEIDLADGSYTKVE